MSLPPSEIPLGAIRFNSDSQKLEYWMGSAWMQIITFSPNLDSGVRGIFYGGHPNSNVIDFVTIPTAGNATDFGDALSANRQRGVCASNVRAVSHGRDGGSDVIEFVTFSSTGNAQDFGDGTVNRAGAPMAVSNGTRGIWAGGDSGPGTLLNVINYVTIAQTGNAVDFGDLNQIHSEGCRAQSPTRGVIGGGRGPNPSSPSFTNAMSYITTATTGNSIDFGDLLIERNEIASDSNAIRGIFAGGNTPGTSSLIEFITIATLGDSIEFGDQSTASGSGRGSASSTRFVFNLGNPSTATIEYVEIATQGDSVDFGDLTSGRGQAAGASNGHGGLG